MQSHDRTNMHRAILSRCHSATYPCTQSCSQLLDHPTVQSVMHPEEPLRCKLGLTPWQVFVLSHVSRIPEDEIVSYGSIATELGARMGCEITAGAVRGTLMRLKVKRHVQCQRARQGVLQGIRITITERRCPFFKASSERFLEQAHPPMHSAAHTAMRAPVESARQSGSSRKKDEKEDSILLSYQTDEGLAAVTQDTLQIHFPRLSLEGFMADSLRQVISENQKGGRSCANIWEGLEHAEWQLENGGIHDKEGKPVSSVAGYVFKALAKNGFYARPVGYVSRQEQYMQERAAWLKQAEETREQLLNQEFKHWRERLTLQDEQELLGPGLQIEGRGKEGKLKMIFQETVWRNEIAPRIEDVGPAVS